MPTVRKNRFISIEEYLETEKKSEIRREYVSGQVYAMVGASKPHNRIAGAIYAALQVHLRGGQCDVFIADMKVKMSDAFYYPDVLVDCQPDEAELYFTETPALIVEVLSPSTRDIDEREKRSAYQRIESLREYVVAEQDRSEIRVYRRSHKNQWQCKTYLEDDLMILDSVGLTISVQTVYENAWR